MTVRAWNLLADGRTFTETRYWIDSNPEGNYYKKPERDTPALRFPGFYVTAPFYNWRFWGNAGVSLF